MSPWLKNIKRRKSYDRQDISPRVLHERGKEYTVPVDQTPPAPCRGFVRAFFDDMRFIVDGNCYRSSGGDSDCRGWAAAGGEEYILSLFYLH